MFDEVICCWEMRSFGIYKYCKFILFKFIKISVLALCKKMKLLSNLVKKDTFLSKNVFIFGQFSQDRLFSCKMVIRFRARLDNNKMNKSPDSKKSKKQVNECVYPAINLYSSSRVFNQRVNNAKIPLLRYREIIRASNCSQSHDADTIDSSLLRKIKQKDGLIYSIKNMKYSSREMNKIGNLKILICVCMYNQSRDAINLTLNGIYKNLAHLKQRGIPPGDVAVVLIQDGILKLVDDKVKKTYAKGNKSMVTFYQKMDKAEGKSKCDLKERINIILNQIQNYDRKGMIGNVSRNRDIPPSIQKNIALVYQNLWHPNKTYFPDSGEPQPTILSPPQNQCLRLFSCFKHTNGTKLSSHLWFFQGFCRYLKPEYCVLLDVGTTPAEDGLANLISGFTLGKNVGGVTGFMNVDIEFKSEQGGADDDDQKDKNKQSACYTCLKDLFFSVERAQQYEYTIAHFLDKNQQSALGFLHVLPGAWSAYRYQALIKSDKYEPNLLQRSYFKIILNPDLQQKDYREANMYLAEDRILSLGIYCQMDEQYTLKYVPNAHAYTDPMKDHENLMNQRRRWINSSLFAFMYVFKNYYFNVMDSKHNFFRTYITLNISMFLALLSTLNSYITPSIYFFVLYATIFQLGFPKADIVAGIVCLIYTIVFLAAVAGALTGREWSKHAYHISAALSLFTFLLFGLVAYNVIIVYIKATSFYFDPSNTTLMIILVLLGVNIACFGSLLLAHLCTHPAEVWSIIKNTASYMSYTGAYAQTMVIHAFCNVDDVSWGTKGSSSSGVSKFQIDKVYFVSTWLTVNAVLTFIFLYVDIISKSTDPTRSDIILLVVAVYGSAVILIKTIFAIYHQMKWLLFEKCCYVELLKPGQPPRINEINKYWENQFGKWKRQQIQNMHEVSNVQYFNKPKKTN